MWYDYILRHITYNNRTTKNAQATAAGIFERTICWYDIDYEISVWILSSHMLVCIVGFKFVREKRSKKEIGISAVRGGTIVGDHDVIFAGVDEVITFSHTAYSKAVFGKGAVQAAKFLAGKPAGFYNMSHVIEEV